MGVVTNKQDGWISQAKQQPGIKSAIRNRNGRNKSEVEAPILPHRRVYLAEYSSADYRDQLALN